MHVPEENYCSYVYVQEEHFLSGSLANDQKRQLDYDPASSSSRPWDLQQAPVRGPPLPWVQVVRRRRSARVEDGSTRRSPACVGTY